jgi:hypothetical protein
VRGCGRICRRKGRRERTFTRGDPISTECGRFLLSLSLSLVEADAAVPYKKVELPSSQRWRWLARVAESEEGRKGRKGLLRSERSRRKGRKRKGEITDQKKRERTGSRPRN